ncbi:MAG TPA: sugar nucleotide-binding protein, partial [Candidatus Binatus sp.]|nr:sugar nucleotide-binding protein [Candidatus Binatus sp.]
MRVVILGAAGQLGRELAQLLRGSELVCLTRADLDLHDAAAVTARLVALAPAAVVNAAADNRVDAAEADPRDAIAVNALAVAAIARACRASDAFLVQPSTDYVFDG